MSRGLGTRPGAITFDLDDLVELAWSGQLRVPHFQRDFRWTRQDVIRLFDSIVKRYPVGSLLLWRRPAPAQRLTLGALRIDAPKVDQALWVVDGQQRVTSLANALHPDGARDLRFNLGYDVRDDRIVSRLVTDDPYVIPLSTLFGLAKVLDWFATYPEVGDYRSRHSNLPSTYDSVRVGHDLPGAVRVLPALDGEGDESEWLPKPAPMSAAQHALEQDTWRFSLAGVALKFSMLAKGDRLTLPAFGVGGDWIVKLPDQTYPDVPRNEFTMMSLAASVGIAVPPVRLVHRDELDGLPPDVWTSREEWAYAIRRFDRDAHRDSVHIEDLVQVRNVYPEDKYLGNYETVAQTS
jgi:hypothetical protein